METDLQKLTDEELQSILAESRDGAQAGLDAKAEIDRRAGARRRWSGGKKRAVAAVLAIVAIAALGIVATLISPAVRHALRLDSRIHPPTKTTPPVTPAKTMDAARLQGVWADSDIAGNGEKTSYEFLPEGRVNVRSSGPTGTPVVSAGGSWFIAGSNLHMALQIAKPGAVAPVYEGKLTGDVIEGDWSQAGSESKHPWRLQRSVAAPQLPPGAPQSAQESKIEAIPGIWVDPHLKIDGGAIFIEFLAEGHVELHDSLSGDVTQPDFIYWYRVGDGIHLTWDKDGVVAQKWDLVLKGNVMEGTLTVVRSGQSSPLKLVCLGS